jgi:uncharacterized protein YjbI with pentapeptide repeats
MSAHHVEARDVSRDYAFVTLDKPPEFQRVTWKAIDFSHAEIDHLRLLLCDVVDCRFVAATLRDWRIWGTHFTDCDFSEAELHTSNGIPYKGRTTEYTECVWRQGRLKELGLSDGTYRHCRFDDVHLADQHVTEARLIECSFSGRLEEITFDGRDRATQQPWAVRPDAMVGCDLRNCSLRYVAFEGIDIRGVDMPPQGQRVPHISRVARNAHQWAETADITDNERRFLRMYWRGHLTKLSDDAEGWLGLDGFQERTKDLLGRAIAGAL